MEDNRASRYCKVLMNIHKINLCLRKLASKGSCLKGIGYPKIMNVTPPPPIHQIGVTSFVLWNVK